MSEARVLDPLTGVLERPLDDVVQRSHRLGRFESYKTRPTMVNDKIKETVVFRRSKLQDKCIVLSEDVSPAMRIITSKLIEFTPFQLRYKKVLVNKKEHVYDAAP